MFFAPIIIRTVESYWKELSSIGGFFSVTYLQSQLIDVQILTDQSSVYILGFQLVLMMRWPTDRNALFSRCHS